MEHIKCRHKSGCEKNSQIRISWYPPIYAAELREEGKDRFNFLDESSDDGGMEELFLCMEHAKEDWYWLIGSALENKEED